MSHKICLTDVALKEKRYFNCLKERVLFKCPLLLVPAQGRIGMAACQTGTLPKTHFQESETVPQYTVGQSLCFRKCNKQEEHMC